MMAEVARILRSSCLPDMPTDAGSFLLTKATGATQQAPRHLRGAFYLSGPDSLCFGHVQLGAFYSPQAGGGRSFLRSHICGISGVCGDTQQGRSPSTLCNYLSKHPALTRRLA
jgi:hypothetical protein